MHFCRDGVLRLKQWVYDPASRTGRTVLLPLDILCDLDPHRFAKHLTYEISFEAGLTVRDLFLNLKPWSHELEGIACMAFSEFVAEVEKPLDPEPETAVSHVELFPTLQITAQPDFEPEAPPHPAGPDGLRESVLPAAKITDRIEIEFGWDYHALYREPQVERFGPGDTDCHTSTSRSLDFDPLTRWHHLPIRLSDRMVLSDETAGLAGDFLSVKTPLLNPGHPWVTAVRSPDGSRLYRHEITLAAPVPTFMTTLVRGFFWSVGFHYSPAGQREAAAAVLSRSDALDSLLESHPDGEIDRSAMAVRAAGPGGDAEAADDQAADWLRQQIDYCEMKAAGLIRWQD